MVALTEPNGSLLSLRLSSGEPSLSRLGLFGALYLGELASELFLTASGIILRAPEKLVASFYILFVLL